ncbi:helix-turn-helix transcriptional regulator [Legionella micdadei]|uniref:Phage transcriptional regulator, AlpA [Prophage CP4-57 regulatory domain] n=1 Tax=Legionella micdadei TaxID=451 RepID=A0A098GEU2_LEGMI|nr:AlpA family phage regulatory protein [Legionella micdadei]KTD28412.1 Prophage CP4-57 regulatory protein (AlpA) [Legionella micdadei]CEG60993.1 Phage transcriptional regulator, AlpA [Prophage CP4-57 regulatory domain] [Legionella micdadei]SCY70156.1 transcriptional regulator, AlpA family [Legionella micdadei]
MLQKPLLVFGYEELPIKPLPSRSSLARWESKGLFPKRVRISPNHVGWRSDEIYQWLEERSNER